MGDFETVIILKGRLTQKNYKKALQEIKDYFTNYKIDKIEEIGKKDLPYSINKNKKGYYVIINFKIPLQDIINIRNFYKSNNNIIKYLILRKK